MKKELLLVFCILVLFLINFVQAERLGIDFKGVNKDKVNFIITLYDNQNIEIDGVISYMIQDYYSDIISESKTNSGEEISYTLPKNPIKGPYKISAIYQDKKVDELFNVGDIKRIEVSLDKDNLVIENTGNVIYDDKLLILIDDIDQTIPLYLDTMQIKRIRLTAPTGNHKIKIDDGIKEPIIFSDVLLTGNVIGNVNINQGNFFQRYPLVSIFLIGLVFVMFIVLGIRYNSKSKKFDKNKQLH